MVDLRLARNYKNLSSLEQKEIYQNCAETYDRELLDEFGYKAPEVAVKKLIEFSPIMKLQFSMQVVDQESALITWLI